MVPHYYVTLRPNNTEHLLGSCIAVQNGYNYGQLLPSTIHLPFLNLIWEFFLYGSGRDMTRLRQSKSPIGDLGLELCQGWIHQTVLSPLAGVGCGGVCSVDEVLQPDPAQRHNKAK